MSEIESEIDYIVLVHFDDGEFIHESFDSFSTLEEALKEAKRERKNRYNMVSVVKGEYIEWEKMGNDSQEGRD